MKKERGEWLMRQRNNSQRLKFEDVKRLVESRGFELLDDFYINSRTKMNLKCKKNHTFTMSVDNLKKGCNCPSCVGVAKPTIDEIKEYLGQYGYTLLDEKYTNNATKLRFLCNNGHEYSARWSQFKRGQRCPQCKGNKRYTIEEVGEYVSMQGYRLLSKDYAGANAKIDLICPNQHEYSCSFHNFLRGKRCPRCAKISRGEKEIEAILNELGVDFKYQHTFHDCKKVFALPFDFYLPSHNIAIEYDGEHHFRPTDFAGKGEEWAKGQFELTQKRDKIKNDYCHANNIKLLRIPYYEFENIKNIITDTLK